MKTYIWAIVGVIVIILIVLLAKGHKTAAPTTDMSATSTVSASPASSTSSANAAMPAVTATATTTTADGLGIAVVKQGSGVAAANGDTITVNYTGMLADGTVFDSNVDPKFGHVQPFSFTLGAGQVIKGWDEGLVGTQVGEEVKLSIPAALGYGASGAGSTIPPNADLVFDVTVTGISHS